MVLKFNSGLAICMLFSLLILLFVPTDYAALMFDSFLSNLDSFGGNFYSFLTPKVFELINCLFNKGLSTRVIGNRYCYLGSSIFIVNEKTLPMFSPSDCT